MPIRPPLALAWTMFVVWGAACTPPVDPPAGAQAPLVFVEAPPVGGGAVSSFSLATDGAGQGVVGWVEGDRVLVSNEASPDGFGEGAVLWDGPSGSAGQLDVAAGPDGEALATWQVLGATGPSSQQIRFADRMPGASWALHADAVSLGDRAYEPRAAIGGDGDRALVWNQWTGAHYGVALATARDASSSFDWPLGIDDVLSPAVNFSNGPRVAAGAGGALLVAWYQATGAELMTFMSERADRMSPPTRPGPQDYLSAPGAPVASDPRSNPKVVLGPDGEAAVVWTQEDGAGHIDVYVATRDAAGEWQTPDDLGDAISDHTGVARGAELAFGARGDLFVVFEQDAAVMLSVRGTDGTWLTPAGQPRTLGASSALDPHVAAGPHGRVVVAFRTLTSPQHELRVVSFQSGAVDLDTPVQAVASGAGLGAPRVVVGGQDDRVRIAVVDRRLDEASLRMFLAP